MKSWINTLSHRFKVPTSVALGLLTDEAYSLNNARARRPPAQYVRAIMQYCISCNIVNIANQLSFAYRGLAPELRVFISPPAESTKAADFIRALEEKQEVWDEMMTTPATPQPGPKIVALQAPPFNSVRGFLSFPDPTTDPPFSTTLESRGPSFRPNTTYPSRRS